jgi:hypothetical protein
MTWATSGECHLDPWAADCLQVSFQALVLLASDHGHIMPGGVQMVTSDGVAEADVWLVGEAGG